MKPRPFSHRHIRTERVIPAGIDAVWQTWTTNAGLESFLAPKCVIELRKNGIMQVLFFPEAKIGERGAEDCHVLGYQEPNMLSFTWNSPPDMIELLDQRTHVTVNLIPHRTGGTSVVLVHDGWGQGEVWDKAQRYFYEAWSDVVLPRLEKRFTDGPIDWSALRRSHEEVSSGD
ncbi:MAG TPA: SRPBCC domain-containing protein [Longilinea sp.]|nr:SRPBCC domain-containing protein [Longilinea sp.]